VEARGLYRQQWQGRPAWIQIFVDQTLKHWEKGWWLKIPVQRDILLSNVLFHELGHHIHATSHPEFREKEDVADDWGQKLAQHYLRGRYPLLRMFVRLLRPLLLQLSKFATRRTKPPK
jgi:hypothetical protein